MKTITITHYAGGFEKGDFVRIGSRSRYRRSSWFCIMAEDNTTLSVRQITRWEHLRSLPKIFYHDLKNLLKSLKTTIVSNH